MAHTCSSLILMIKKERKIMYMERFQPATFYLIHYTYIYIIISTLRLYNTCGLFIYYYFLLYVIKEITKKANNSIEFRTMQVDVRFFSRKYTYSSAARYQTCCRSRSTSRSGHKDNDILSIQSERLKSAVYTKL